MRITYDGCAISCSCQLDKYLSRCIAYAVAVSYTALLHECKFCIFTLLFIHDAFFFFQIFFIDYTLFIKPTLPSSAINFVSSHSKGSPYNCAVSEPQLTIIESFSIHRVVPAQKAYGLFAARQPPPTIYFSTSKAT